MPDQAQQAVLDAELEGRRAQLEAGRLDFRMEPAVERSPTVLKRPSGTGLLWTGGAMLGVGALLILIGFTADRGLWWSWLILGSSLASVGSMLWALGAVVRALFFLPGREVTSAEL